MKTTKAVHVRVVDAEGTELTKQQFLDCVGPIVKIKVTNLLNGRSREGFGLLDTGATKTCLDPTVILQLGIIEDAVRVAVNSTLEEQNERPVYSNYEVEIPLLQFKQAIFGANSAHTIAILPYPNEVIGVIGRDILQHSLFTYNGLTSEVEISI